MGGDSVKNDIHPVERVLELVLGDPVSDTIAAHVNTTNAFRKSKNCCKGLYAFLTQLVVRQVYGLDLDVAAAEGLCEVLDPLVRDLVALEIELFQPLRLSYVLVNLVDVVVADASAAEAKHTLVNLCAESGCDG